MREVVRLLPEYNYLYLGDNARVPYGNRSQAIVYEFTRQAVELLFRQGCQLIIVACNSASAKALRRVQREFLPGAYPNRRVLGVIRPSVERSVEGGFKKIGIFATEGVVASNAYVVELHKLDHDVEIYQQACPLLVPIVEAGEQDWEGTDMIVSKYTSKLFNQNAMIEAILLACTHYPILYKHFRKHVPSHVYIFNQGPIVAEKLKDYLFRHPEIDDKLVRKGERRFITTDTSEKFDRLAQIFYGEQIHSELVPLYSFRNTV